MCCWFGHGVPNCTGLTRSSSRSKESLVRLRVAFMWWWALVSLVREAIRSRGAAPAGGLIDGRREEDLEARVRPVVRERHAVESDVAVHGRVRVRRPRELRGRRGS